MTHVITITAYRYFPSSCIHVATCSCGEYTSTNHVFVESAESAARTHVLMRQGLEFNPADFYRQMRHVEESLLEAQ